MKSGILASLSPLAALALIAPLTKLIDGVTCIVVNDGVTRDTGDRVEVMSFEAG